MSKLRRIPLELLLPSCPYHCWQVIWLDIERTDYTGFKSGGNRPGEWQVVSNHAELRFEHEVKSLKTATPERALSGRIIPRVNG